MELLEILKYGAYVFTGIIGWFVKQLWDAVTSLKKDVHELEIKLTEECVRKDDLTRILERVFNKLDRIEDYLLSTKKE